jgi:hypothetical protein
MTASPTFLPTLILTTAVPTAPLTLEPTVAPTASIVEVTVPRFSIAYVLQLPVEPTAEEHEMLRVATVAYYQDFLTTRFSTNRLVEFLDIEFTLDFTLYNAGMPEARFNVYQEYSEAVARFTPSRSNPDSATIFTILQSGITTEFLLNTVRTLVGTPFVSVNEGQLSTV